MPWKIIIAGETCHSLAVLSVVVLDSLSLGDAGEYGSTRPKYPWTSFSCDDRTVTAQRHAAVHIPSNNSILCMPCQPHNASIVRQHKV